MLYANYKLDMFQEKAVASIDLHHTWWDIPGEASAEMEELFEKVAKV